ncbi:DHH family phosphoesterase, partial [Ruminococcaceae bacterium OttesenSCG-928-A11]|nr:DHH family phosphoesterase [Ruminococcaceae bacterium OttesenSCG-928-A11]
VAKGLATFAVPVVALSDEVVVWYNDAFLERIVAGQDSCLMPAAKVVPGLDLAAAAAHEGQDLSLGGLRYTAYGNASLADKSLYFVIFIEDTALKEQAGEYLATRPSVLYFMIDTYDEILKGMRESDRAIIVSGIDLALERFIGKGNGFLRRVSTSRYLAVVEERQVAQMIEGRFDILDEVRSAHEDATVTLSIGMGRASGSFKECEEAARQALDMALGRGGDQAAVKGPEGFEFFGGVARSVEKRTKVKSRIVATAIKDLMQGFDKVLVMGHKNSDMDCVGAAVGMLRFCRICQKPSAIVIDQPTSMAGPLLDLLNANGYKDDLLGCEEALSLTGQDTLLVVVDTHMPYLLECKEVYTSCGAVVVIDHHRRMVGHIDNAAIFYHEPYASSASELVSELLQYVGDGKEDKPTPVEAEALLSGIMLDTRTFSLHVGVRTFEASAWLRRMGAQTAAVKKLFATSKDDYLYRCHLVGEAAIEKGCAIALSDKIPPENEVVAPQAANELLSIEGVQASFVGVKQGDEVRVSARSMGEVNVQLVLEKIGGGGHLTMAGAQLKCELDEAETMIRNAINEYMQERAQSQGAPERGMAR